MIEESNRRKQRLELTSACSDGGRCGEYKGIAAYCGDRTRRLTRGRRLMRGHTNHAVAVQILVEARFILLERRARSRQCARVALIVAVGIGKPDDELAASRNLPGHLVTARGLFGAYWRPGSKLTGCHGGAGVAELHPCAISVRHVEVVPAGLRQDGRAQSLDRGAWNADRVVAVQILVEAHLVLLQRRAGSR